MIGVFLKQQNRREFWKVAEKDLTLIKSRDDIEVFVEINIGKQREYKFNN